MKSNLIDFNNNNNNNNMREGTLTTCRLTGRNTVKYGKVGGIPYIRKL